MTKQTSHTSSRTRTVLLVTVAVTNILSFVVGVAAAGHIAINRSSTPIAVATPSPAKSTAAARATKRAAASAKPTVAHALAAAATASARAGQTVQPAPMPIAGKGMWIYEFDKVARGNVRRLVRDAKVRGLTHIYVRAGSSVAGLSGFRDIAKILPVAHAAGLKVIAWYFPYLRAPAADARAMRWVANHQVNGHRVDGLAADVETSSEGVTLTRYRARLFARILRAETPGKFLVLVPPRANPYTRSFYPFDALVPYFDAIAPMIYWGRQAPDKLVAQSLNYFRRFGKPVAPIGQAYDMGPEGGPKGHPRGNALVRFMNESETRGAVGVSFWSWQHTPTPLWRAIYGYAWRQ